MDSATYDVSELREHGWIYRAGDPDANWRAAVKAECKRQGLRYRSAKSKWPPGIVFVLKSWHPSALQRQLLYAATGYHYCIVAEEGQRLMWLPTSYNFCPYCSDELPARDVILNVAWFDA